MIRKRLGPPPINQCVDVHLAADFIAPQPLSGYLLKRPEDGSSPEFLTMDAKNKRDACKGAVWRRARRAESQMNIQPFRPDTRGTWKMLTEDMAVEIPETTDSEIVGAALSLALDRGWTFEG